MIRKQLVLNKLFSDHIRAILYHHYHVQYGEFDKDKVYCR